MRPLSADDVENLLAYRSRADVCRYLPFGPQDNRQIHERLAGPWAPAGLDDEGQSLTLGITLAETGGLIGDVVLFWHSKIQGAGEIGYVLHPGFTGHGYATEAAAAMMELGFRELGLHRIIAHIDGRNCASVAVAARLGMRPEAHLLSSHWFKGEWADELVFAMLANEWDDLHPPGDFESPLNGRGDRI